MEYREEKAARFAELVRRLARAPRASTSEEARALIDGILVAVEDEMSGIPYNPAAWRTDGRMYPVQPDRVSDIAGHPGITRLRARKHDVLVGSNGAIRIVDRHTNEAVLDSPGRDGVRIPAEVR